MQPQSITTMKILQLVVLIFFILSTTYCSKRVDPPEVIPDPEPTIIFEIPQTEDIVMYEVNLRAFSNAGDLKRVTSNLNHIKSLGVNVIWLMPIYPIGEINSVNSPYSVKNYTQVNPEFGTLADLKELVISAHNNNMAVILDWVANHTAWDNPWINNPDWYTQDGSGNIVIPPGTNWQDVADLNFDNQQMRLEMIESMQYWIDSANVDGFRCDAADMVPFDFWKQAIDSLDHFNTKELVMLAEGGRSDHFTAGFDLNFSWDFYTQIKKVFSNTASPSSLYATNTAEYQNIPNGKQKLRFTTNHDESAWDATPMVLFNGKNGALAASVITIYLSGTPLIYDGQEVGVVEKIPFFTKSPIDWTLNPDMLSEYNRMLAFYNTSTTLKTGALTTYNDASVVAFKYQLNTDETVVLVNTKNSAISFELPDELINTQWSNAMNEASITLTNPLEMQPYGYLILTGN